MSALAGDGKGSRTRHRRPVVVYHVALLRFLGCTSDAAETAVLAGGDDIAFNATMAPMFMAQPGEGMRHFVRHLAEDLPPRRRVGRVARALTDPGMQQQSLSAHCEVAARLGCPTRKVWP